MITAQGKIRDRDTRRRALTSNYSFIEKKRFMKNDARDKRHRPPKHAANMSKHSKTTKQVQPCQEEQERMCGCKRRQFQIEYQLARTQTLLPKNTASRISEKRVTKFGSELGPRSDAKSHTCAVFSGFPQRSSEFSVVYVCTQNWTNRGRQSKGWSRYIPPIM